MSEEYDIENYAVEQKKLQRLKLLRERRDLMKEFGLLFYKPHHKQKLFHEAAHFRFRLASCGNRFGKSDMGVSEDLAFALGYRPWIDEGDPMRTHGIPKRPTKGLVIAADLDKVEEVFTGTGQRGHIGKIWKKIPKDLIIGTKKSQNGVITNMRIKSLYGESVIDFDTRSSYKNNPMGSESSDYDWVHVDEPIEEGHWKAILRGLTDRGGKAWFTCTLIEQPWINDFFYRTPESVGKELVSLVDEDGRAVRWVMRGSIYDNPYLTEANIKDFLETLTPEEQECRIKGLPMHLAGLIYKDFDQASHCYSKPPPGWESMNKPPSSYTVHYSVDPHPRTPHAGLFAAVAPNNITYIYDEFFKNGSSEELADMIIDRTNGYNVYHATMDPSAWIVDQRVKTCLADDLIEYGITELVKGQKDPGRGIQMTKQRILDRDIYISLQCTQLLWELSRYAWDNKRGVPLNKPVDRDDHLIECLHRILLEGTPFVSFTTPSQPPVETYDVPDLSSPYNESDLNVPGV